MKAIVSWAGKMACDADVDGFVVPMDSDPEHGGTHHGPAPKALVLTALGGCTAMEVMAILQKMRVPVESLEVEVESGLATEHPKVFTGVGMVYRFTGRDLPAARLKRAIELSLEHYCAISAMLRNATTIRWEFWVNGEKVERDSVA